MGEARTEESDGFKAWIVQLCEGASQSAVARKTGLSQTYISKICRGKVKGRVRMSTIETARRNVDGCVPSTEKRSAELEVMGGLDLLDDAARARVLRWAFEKWGSDLVAGFRPMSAGYVK